MSVAQRMRLLVDVDKTTPQATPKNDLYQGDKNANQIVLEMMRGDEKVNLQGYAASASMERSDGSQVPCTGKVTGSTVTITLNEHCYVFAGPYKLDIELSGGSDGLRRTVAQITGTVRKTASGPVVEVEEEIIDVDAVLALYAEMKQAKDDANSAATAANNAAASANSAASKASTATTNANKATTAANNAAQTATTAAGNANEATTNANNAAGAANQAAGRAESVASKSPYIGDNGNWYIYDVSASEYVDSGFPSRGIPGMGAVSTVNSKQPDADGNVVLGAEDVGARPDNWTPTADEVGALAVDGTAADSSKLGGKAASYYMAASAPRIQMDLLWANASPNSQFAAQTVSIDLSAYDMVVVVFKGTPSGTGRFSVMAGVSAGTTCFGITIASYTLIYRLFEVTSTGIVFNSANVLETYGEATKEVVNRAMPVLIYGLKGVEE